MTKSSSRPPKMGNNGGTAFVRINGKRVYLGRFGSPEAAQNYARCVAEWATTGTTPEQSAQPIGTTTVKSLAIAFLDHIQKNDASHYCLVPRNFWDSRRILDAVIWIGRISYPKFCPCQGTTMPSDLLSPGYCNFTPALPLTLLRRNASPPSSTSLPNMSGEMASVVAGNIAIRLRAIFERCFAGEFRRNWSRRLLLMPSNMSRRCDRGAPQHPNRYHAKMSQMTWSMRHCRTCCRQ